MKSFEWIKTPEGFECRSGGAPLWRASVEPFVALESLAPPRLGLSLPLLSYRGSLGATYAAAPHPRDPYIQGATLVLPAPATDDVGMRLTARFLAEEPGMLCEFRLQTVLPADQATLAVEVVVPGPVELSLSRETAEEGKAYSSASSGVVRGPGGAPVVLADLGEAGGMVARPAGVAREKGWRLCYEFFRQWLEKGVILVGRMALSPAPLDPSIPAADHFRAFRARRDFL